MSEQKVIDVNQTRNYLVVTIQEPTTAKIVLKRVVPSFDVLIALTQVKRPDEVLVVETVEMSADQAREFGH